MKGCERRQLQHCWFVVITNLLWRSPLLRTFLQPTATKTSHIAEPRWVRRPFLCFQSRMDPHKIYTVWICYECETDLSTRWAPDVLDLGSLPPVPKVHLAVKTWRRKGLFLEIDVPRIEPLRESCECPTSGAPSCTDENVHEWAYILLFHQVNWAIKLPFLP